MAKPLPQLTILGLISLLAINASYAEKPEITGSPTIDKPQLLEWPLDIPSEDPDLSESTTNNTNDLHARISKCDDVNVVFSIAGNYHMALRNLWYDHFIEDNKEIIGNWFYATTPPIS